MEQNSVVSAEKWREARQALLIKEKEFSRAREALAAERRRLPWEAVTKTYMFDGPDGARTLAELFAGMSQLAVYHFMLPRAGGAVTDPAWDAGCPNCSFWADHFDASLVHLRVRDVSLVAISRAPFEMIAGYQRRMGWTFPWLSSAGTDFNYDLGVSFTADSLAAHTAVYNYGSFPGFEDREGISIFYRDRAGQVFHTYSTYARGIDMVNATYQWLDLVPKGRDERGDPLGWVCRHDEYDH